MSTYTLLRFGDGEVVLWCGPVSTLTKLGCDSVQRSFDHTDGTHPEVRSCLASSDQAGRQAQAARGEKRASAVP